MNTNYIIGIVIVAIILIGGYFLFTAESTDIETDTDSTDVSSETPAPDGLGDGVDETQVVDQNTQSEDGSTEGTDNADNGAATAPESDSEENIITYTNTGFSPGTITVSLGETVTWVNESNSSVWVASAFHPTHTVYPGSDIQKCGTPQEAGIFDACEGIASGASWSFTFNSAGTWNYHNHLSPARTGKVVVQ